jgi:hypothetical protein
MYICIYKGKLRSFLTLKTYCEQPSIHIGMRSLPLTRKFHEEHNDRYCDPCSTVQAFFGNVNTLASSVVIYTPHVAIVHVIIV